MLVLTRKQNEQIQIGDDICLTVLRIKGNTVRLGIDAPASVRVVRGELPRKPQVNNVTLMVTDTKTGKVSEQWSGRPDLPTTKLSSRMGLNEPSDDTDQQLKKEVNRLQQIVGQVTSHSWPMDTPNQPS